MTGWRVNVRDDEITLEFFVNDETFPRVLIAVEKDGAGIAFHDNGECVPASRDWETALQQVRDRIIV